MSERSADKCQQVNLDDLLRRALKTPPISNEEIERRSKAGHKPLGLPYDRSLRKAGGKAKKV